MPVAEDWDDPDWKRWIVWRHSQMVDYLQALKVAAREVNPNIVFFEENWNVDSSGATQYANDPAAYLRFPDLSSGHEVSTVGDRVDAGETGMRDATLDQWLAYRTMIAFARGADRGKPSWILTYGYQPRDSAQLAEMVLAEGGNFYETQGPVMNATVGEDHRTRLFRWIKAHEDAIYDSESAAEVGLVYSPRTRDLLDAGSGGLYDAEDSTHFAAYRAAASLLYRAHVPFDVVLDTDTEAFDRYRLLILPEVQAISDDTVSALERYPGRLIATGDTGWHDEWMVERQENVLEEMAWQHFDTIDARLVTAADTLLLSTDAPPDIQIGLRRAQDGYAFVLVNTAAAAASSFNLGLRLPSGVDVHAARIFALDGEVVKLPLLPQTGDNIVRLKVPAGLETVALLKLDTR